MNKFRYRDVMLVSAVMLIVGTALLGFVMDDSNQPSDRSTLFMVVVGLGIGVSFSLLNISTLNAVPPQYKGTVVVAHHVLPDDRLRARHRGIRSDAEVTRSNRASPICLT